MDFRAWLESGSEPPFRPYWHPSMPRSAWAWARAVFGALVLLPVRLVLILLFTILYSAFAYSLCCCSCSGGPPRGCAFRALRVAGIAAGRVALWLLGFYWIPVEGERDESVVAVISNHTSFLDVLLFMWQCFPSFVAKAATRTVPFIGYLSEQFDCVFVTSHQRPKSGATAVPTADSDISIGNSRAILDDGLPTHPVASPPLHLTSPSTAKEGASSASAAAAVNPEPRSATNETGAARAQGTGSAPPMTVFVVSSSPPHASAAGGVDLEEDAAVAVDAPRAAGAGSAEAADHDVGHGRELPVTEAPEDQEQEQEQEQEQGQGQQGEEETGGGAMAAAAAATEAATAAESAAETAAVAPLGGGSAPSRGASSALEQRMQELAAGRARGERDADRAPVLVFPEGTTSNGHFLPRFRTGAFRPGLRVQPAVVTVAFETTAPTWEAIPFWVYAFNMLTQWWQSMRVQWLPPMEPNAGERERWGTSGPEEFAERVRRAIADAGGLPLANTSLEDKWAFHRGILRGELQWEWFRNPAVRVVPRADSATIQA